MGPIAALNFALLHASGAAPEQQRRMLAGLTVTTLAFAAESFALRRRSASLDWLLTSLVLTSLALGVAMWMSGGAESPLLALLFAPTVTALAAFGRSPRGWLALASGALVLLLLLLVDPRAPAPAQPWSGRMALSSTVGALALLTLSVTGLFDAYGRAASALERLRLEALSESRERTRSIELTSAKVAHELKNPLAAIKGLAQLLAKRPLEPRDQRRFGVMEGEIERVEAILRDYLSFTRPMTDLELRRTNLRELIEEIAISVEGRALTSSVEVTASGPDSLADVDPRRLREAVLNLAQNAIEAMPTGGALRLGIEHDRGAVLIVVEDEGPGLFEDTAVEPFESKKQGGTGLGLAIARGVAELHGGSLKISPREPRGTRVTLSLGATALTKRAS